MSARASVLYLGARVFSGVMSVITVSLFARGIGPESYAWLTLVTAGNALVASVLLQPLNQSLARFMPRAGFGDLLATLSRLFMLGAIPFLLLALAVEAWRPSWLPAGVAIGVWALGMAQGVFDFACQHANTSLQPRRYSLLYIVKATLVLCIGLLVLRVHRGADGALAAMVCGFVLAALGVGWPTWRAAWRDAWRPALLRQIAPYAVPFAGTLFLGAILAWADRLILGALAPAAQTGGYGAASDLVLQGLVLISSAFFLAWYPRMVIAAEQGRRQELESLYQRYAVLALALLLPVALGYALVRHNLVAVLLGQAYSDVSVRVMPWLALSALLAGVRTYLLEIPLHIGNRMRLHLRNVAACAVTSVVLNLLLVPRYGAVGAAMAGGVAQAVGCLLAWTAARGVMRRRVPLIPLLYILAGCAAMALAVSLIAHGGIVGLLMEVSTGVTVYAIFMFAGNVAGCRDRILTRWKRRHD
ncbi:MAG: lipopolysaccharide biosynthesis protein [Rhodocyclaceae bacterium]